MATDGLTLHPPKFGSTVSITLHKGGHREQQVITPLCTAARCVPGNENYAAQNMRSLKLDSRNTVRKLMRTVDLGVTHAREIRKPPCRTSSSPALVRRFGGSSGGSPCLSHDRRSRNLQENEFSRRRDSTHLGHQSRRPSLK